MNNKLFSRVVHPLALMILILLAIFQNCLAETSSDTLFRFSDVKLPLKASIDATGYSMPVSFYTDETTNLLLEAIQNNSVETVFASCGASNLSDYSFIEMVGISFSEYDYSEELKIRIDFSHSFDDKDSILLVSGIINENEVRWEQLGCSVSDDGSIIATYQLEQIIDVQEYKGVVAALIQTQPNDSTEVIFYEDETTDSLIDAIYNNQFETVFASCGASDLDDYMFVGLRGIQFANYDGHSSLSVEIDFSHSFDYSDQVLLVSGLIIQNDVSWEQLEYSILDNGSIVATYQASQINEIQQNKGVIAALIQSHQSDVCEITFYEDDVINELISAIHVTPVETVFASCGADDLADYVFVELRGIDFLNYDGVSTLDVLIDFSHTFNRTNQILLVSGIIIDYTVSWEQLDYDILNDGSLNATYLPQQISNVQQNQGVVAVLLHNSGPCEISFYEDETIATLREAIQNSQVDTVFASCGADDLENYTFIELSGITFSGYDGISDVEVTTPFSHTFKPEEQVLLVSGIIDGNEVWWEQLQCTVMNDGNLSAVYTSDQVNNVLNNKGVIAALVNTSDNYGTLRLPSGTIVIDAEAFQSISAKKVIIPEGCTTIGSRAFANCPNLQYVYIPASVTSIAADAFEGSDNVVIDRQTQQ